MHSRLRQCHCAKWNRLLSRSMVPASSQIWVKARTDSGTHRVAAFRSPIPRARLLVQVSHSLLAAVHPRPPAAVHPCRYLYLQPHELVEDWYTTLEQKQRCSWPSWRSSCETLGLDHISYIRHRQKHFRP